MTEPLSLGELSLAEITHSRSKDLWEQFPIVLAERLLWRGWNPGHEISSLRNEFQKKTFFKLVNNPALTCGA